MTNAQNFVARMRMEPKRYRVFAPDSPEIVAMLEAIEAADWLRFEMDSDGPVAIEAINRFYRGLDALPGGDDD